MGCDWKRCQSLRLSGARAGDLTFLDAKSDHYIGIVTICGGYIFQKAPQNVKKVSLKNNKFVSAFCCNGVFTGARWPKPLMSGC
jgi:hypothetical protein